jgi:hypothetical protein
LLVRCFLGAFSELTRKFFSAFVRTSFGLASTFFVALGILASALFVTLSGIATLWTSQLVIRVLTMNVAVVGHLSTE